MAPSSFPYSLEQSKARKSRVVKPHVVKISLPKTKTIHIHFTSLQSLISTYQSQHLAYTTDHFTPQQLLDLEDHWNLLISDCFREIYERTLKCATCPEIHYNKAIEECLEGVRTVMERTPVLEITEDDVEGWEDEIGGLIGQYWEELGREGGCPETWPKPGTLVNGRLVLDEWEEKVRCEWMERMFGEKWREHPVVTGKVDDVEEEEIIRSEMLDVDGSMVMMETAYDEIIGRVAPRNVDMGSATMDFNFDEEEEEEEEEEEGITARILRELGMQDYEYRGKEIDYGKPGPDELVRETNEAKEARLMREFGMEYAEKTNDGQGGASKEHLDLTMGFDVDDEDEENEDMGLELKWD